MLDSCKVRTQPLWTRLKMAQYGTIIAQKESTLSHETCQKSTKSTMLSHCLRRLPKKATKIVVLTANVTLASSAGTASTSVDQNLGSLFGHTTATASRAPLPPPSPKRPLPPPSPPPPLPPPSPVERRSGPPRPIRSLLSMPSVKVIAVAARAQMAPAKTCEN